LIPGIGPKTAARLAELGLRTLSAVGAAPERLLVERFGENHGRDIGRRARFEHEGRIGEPRKVVSESRERTFDEDLTEPAALREALAEMARRLCAGLAANGRGGRTIAIKVRLDDFTTVTRARTIAEATCDADIVTDVALQLLEQYAPARPVRLLGVRVAGLTSSEPAQEAGEGSPGIGGASRAAADQLALPV
jgi:DNA polymerase-4